MGMAEPEKIEDPNAPFEVPDEILKFLINRGPKIRQKAAKGNETARDLISTFKKFTNNQTKENGEALIIGVKAYRNSLKNFK